MKLFAFIGRLPRDGLNDDEDWRYYYVNLPFAYPEPSSDTGDKIRISSFQSRSKSCEDSDSDSKSEDDSEPKDDGDNEEPNMGPEDGTGEMEDEVDEGYAPL
ncbi:hypothetical protein C8R45DRAFT_1090893 [Mycena sanguinolenta]|nr:hypothetical protein C8R45DRAFT_1090893 [Mycena sanguinolenta]